MAYEWLAPIGCYDTEILGGISAKMANPTGGWVVERDRARDSTGKRYFEGKRVTGTSSYYTPIGIIGTLGYSWNVAQSSDGIYTNAPGGGFLIVSPFPAVGDVIMVAVDFDAGYIWFGCNGAWWRSGDPAAGANPGFDNITPTYLGDYGRPFAQALILGDGFRLYLDPAEWSYSAPTGFSAFTDTTDTTTFRVHDNPVRRIRARSWLAGRYQRQAIIKERGAPGRYLVVLYDRDTKLPVQAVWSAADGSYEFRGLTGEADRFFVVGLDHGSAPVNAAISDYLQLDPMVFP